MLGLQILKTIVRSIVKGNNGKFKNNFSSVFRVKAD